MVSQLPSLLVERTQHQEVSPSGVQASLVVLDSSTTESLASHRKDPLFCGPMPAEIKSEPVAPLGNALRSTVHIVYASLKLPMTLGHVYT
jgi:hypothetical protein